MLIENRDCNLISADPDPVSLKVRIHEGRADDVPDVLAEGAAFTERLHLTQLVQAPAERLHQKNSILKCFRVFYSKVNFIFLFTNGSLTVDVSCSNFTNKIYTILD